MPPPNAVKSRSSGVEQSDENSAASGSSSFAVSIAVSSFLCSESPSVSLGGEFVRHFNFYYLFRFFSHLNKKIIQG